MGRDIIGLSAGARRRLWIQSRGKHLSFKTTRDVSMSSKAFEEIRALVTARHNPGSPAFPIEKER